MAKPSETLLHPILGSLAWDSKSNWWQSTHQLPSGIGLDVVLDPGDGDRVQFVETAVTLFQWALLNERHILHEAMQAEMLDLYNDVWRRGEGSELSEEELTARLEWHLLAVTSNELVPVEFGYAAGELFGGHSVTVEVGPDMLFRDIDLR